MADKALLERLGFPPIAGDHYTDEQLGIIAEQDPATWRDSLPPNYLGGELHVTKQEPSGVWVVTSHGSPDGDVVIEWGAEDPMDAEEWFHKLWNHHIMFVEDKPVEDVDLSKREVPEPTRVNKRQKHKRVHRGG